MWPSCVAYCTENCQHVTVTRETLGQVLCLTCKKHQKANQSTSNNEWLLVPSLSTQASQVRVETVHDRQPKKLSCLVWTAHVVSLFFKAGQRWWTWNVQIIERTWLRNWKAWRYRWIDQVYTKKSVPTELISGNGAYQGYPLWPCLHGRDTVTRRKLTKPPAMLALFNHHGIPIGSLASCSQCDDPLLVFRHGLYDRLRQYCQCKIIWHVNPTYCNI